jgi:hypothetical protein
MALGLGLIGWACPAGFKAGVNWPKIADTAVQFSLGKAGVIEGELRSRYGSTALDTDVTPEDRAVAYRAETLEIGGYRGR